MKKHSLAEFLKSKGFYGLICVGALAIIAITMISLNQSSDKKGMENKQNLVDLNEPAPNDQDSLDTANNEDGSGTNEVADIDGDRETPVTDGSLLENDIYDESLLPGNKGNQNSGDVAEGVEVPDPNQPTDVAQKPDEEEPSSSGNEVADVEEPTDIASNSNENQEPTKEVMTPATLNFDVDKGLLWPVTGNVLMNYSVDRVIYHSTLEQFRVNPALVIDAEVGTQVVNAAKGIVTNITTEDETGVTVTVDVGSGYQLVYGQLQGVVVEVGDTVLEGDVIGEIANPSKYYSVEGSNLYFKVLKDDETVNPMLLLR